MKVKTSELTGAALDWVVAKCKGDDTLAVYFDEETGEPLCRDDWPDNQEFKPSTDWAQGGPIIEREWIELVPWPNESDENNRWEAIQYDLPVKICCVGPTPLIAAMRCYVASKLGDEVEVIEVINALLERK